jgi:hypothetical protein
VIMMNATDHADAITFRASAIGILLCGGAREQG